jgi:hypothetical protein
MMKCKSVHQCCAGPELTLKQGKVKRVNNREAAIKSVFEVFASNSKKYVLNQRRVCPLSL